MQEQAFMCFEYFTSFNARYFDYSLLFSRFMMELCKSLCDINIPRDYNKRCANNQFFLQSLYLRYEKILLSFN